MMISCGEDRGDSVAWGLLEGAEAAIVGLGGEETEPEAVRAAGGGLAAATGVEVLEAAEWEVGFFAILRVSG